MRSRIAETVLIAAAILAAVTSTYSLFARKREADALESLQHQSTALQQQIAAMHEALQRPTRSPSVARLALPKSMVAPDGSEKVAEVSVPREWLDSTNEWESGTEWARRGFELLQAHVDELKRQGYR